MNAEEDKKNLAGRTETPEGSESISPPLSVGNTGRSSKKGPGGSSAAPGTVLVKEGLILLVSGAVVTFKSQLSFGLVFRVWD